MASLRPPAITCQACVRLPQKSAKKTACDHLPSLRSPAPKIRQVVAIRHFISRDLACLFLLVCCWSLGLPERSCLRSPSLASLLGTGDLLLAIADDAAGYTAGDRWPIGLRPLASLVAINGLTFFASLLVAIACDASSCAFFLRSLVAIACDRLLRPSVTWLLFLTKTVVASGWSRAREVRPIKILFFSFIQLLLSF